MKGVMFPCQTDRGKREGRNRIIVDQATKDASKGISWDNMCGKHRTEYPWGVAEASGWANIDLQERCTEGKPPFDKTMRHYIPPEAFEAGKEKAMTEEIKITEVQFDELVSKLDKAFQAEGVTNLKTAIAVFDAHDLAFQLSQSPDGVPRKRFGDFTKKLDDCTLMRTTTANGVKVLYRIVPDGAVSNRDYWIVIGM